VGQDVQLHAISAAVTSTVQKLRRRSLGSASIRTLPTWRIISRSRCRCIHVLPVVTRPDGARLDRIAGRRSGRSAPVVGFGAGGKTTARACPLYRTSYFGP